MIQYDSMDPNIETQVSVCVYIYIHHCCKRQLGTAWDKQEATTLFWLEGANEKMGSFVIIQ